MSTRGETDESEHRIHAVVSNIDRRSARWGQDTRPVIPRSAIKFIQAIPLLRTGAADHFNVSDTEVVLACSSHSGEQAHVDAVRAWLDRIGLDEGALECGPDLPIAGAGDRTDVESAPIYNCCSGKHAGFLTVARHLGIDHRGYVEPDHPVQRLVTESIEQLTGVGLADQRPGRDGCAIPTFAVPLAELAHSMARLTDPERLGREIQTASTSESVRRLVDVQDGRQFWISGTGRHEVFLADAVDEPLLVKAGAEGVYMAALPDRGLGFACKAEDGASRAAEIAISALLSWAGVLKPELVAGDVVNKPNDVVGRLIAVDTEPDASDLD